MTEEIIIDGVNVAGCEFCKPNPLYKIEYACHCRGYIQDDGLHVHLSCEHNPNCYYKQLKRLDQENKSNKELLIIAQNEAMEAQFDRDKYKDALEEIRNDIMSNKSVCTECIKIAKRINEVLQ